MPTHLLDTSVYCQPLKPRPIPQVVERWTSLGDARLVISVIADAEVRFGLEIRQSVKLTAAYEQMLCGRLQVLPIDELVGESFALLKAQQQRKGQPRTDLDLLIAATARAHRLVVATLNAKHFQDLDGVTVEDWSSSG